jgi:hypothetical protein
MKGLRVRHAEWLTWTSAPYMALLGDSNYSRGTQRGRLLLVLWLLGADLLHLTQVCVLTYSYSYFVSRAGELPDFPIRLNE